MGNGKMKRQHSLHCLAKLKGRKIFYILNTARWKVDASAQAQALPTGEDILFRKTVRQRRIFGARKENFLHINFQCNTLE